MHVHPSFDNAHRAIARDVPDIRLGRRLGRQGSRRYSVSTRVKNMSRFATWRTREGAVSLGVPRLALAFKTSCDYHEAMKGVPIAELKSRLSEHLRKVRAGRTVTILDRSTPIARIVPYEDSGSSLTVRPPHSGSPAVKDVPLPPPLRVRRDVVALLLEERQGER